MNVTIVDYNSGNISSVINSFKEVAKEKVNIEVTSDLEKIKLSDKLVLPGQGSFKSCFDALNSINGLIDTLNEFAINNKKPLLGICVGLQMFADIGYEETETNGLGWISGKVSKINNQNNYLCYLDRVFLEDKLIAQDLAKGVNPQLLAKSISCHWDIDKVFYAIEILSKQCTKKAVDFVKALDMVKIATEIKELKDPAKVDIYLNTICDFDKLGGKKLKKIVAK